MAVARNSGGRFVCSTTTKQLHHCFYGRVFGVSSIFFFTFIDVDDPVPPWTPGVSSLQPLVTEYISSLNHPCTYAPMSMISYLLTGAG
jgi:hypothetical protein